MSEGRIDQLEKTMRDLLFVLNYLIEVTDAPPAIKAALKRMAKERSDAAVQEVLKHMGGHQ